MVERMILYLLLSWMVATPSLAQGPLDSQPLSRISLRRELIGCYALHVGRLWLPRAKYYNAAPFIRLDSTLHAWQPPIGTIRKAVPLDSSFDDIEVSKRLAPFWRADSMSDSVRISFSNGFSGAFLVLAAPQQPRADTLSGLIANSWDFGPPFVTDRAFVQAVRVRCTRH
jgi:hypothetical protein